MSVQCLSIILLMKLIAEESGLKGKILRPLSAKFVPETACGKEGFS